MKLELYKVIISPNKPGVFNLSMVKKPAIDSAFLALSEADNVIELTTIDEERRIVLGAVLIPDKLIFRDQGGKKFNIVFDKEGIALCAHNFIKNGYQNNSSIEHNKIALSDVSVVESWVKESDINDKSVAHGIDLPVGTWFVMSKIDNDEVWDDYVKTGKVTGYSIEGLFDLEEVNLNSHNKTDEMKTEDIIKGITAFLEGKLPTFVKLGKATTEDGTVTFNFDGDTLEAGKTAITMTGTDGELPVPDGTYRVDLNGTPTDLEVKDSIVQTITAAPADTPATPLADNPPAPAATNMEAQTAAAKVASQKETRETVFALSKVIGESIAKATGVMEAKYEKLITEKDAQIIALTKAREEAPLKRSEMSAFQVRQAEKAGHTIID